jgi:hypothetical protein
MSKTAEDIVRELAGMLVVGGFKNEYGWVLECKLCGHRMDDDDPDDHRVDCAYGHAREWVRLNPVKP